MFSTINDFIQTMATVLFLTGFISLGIGIFILARQAMGKQVQTIAEQTAKLAQKGLAEDISGLVGNASSLLSALEDLIRTTAGIGIILILISFALLGSSYALVSQIKINLEHNDGLGRFLKKLRQTIPPEDGQNIIFALQREPLIWQHLQEVTYYEKVFQIIGSRIEGWNPIMLALIAMDLHDEADQLLHQPLLPLDSELFRSAIDSYEETLSNELPPDNLAKAGMLALALRERFLLKDSWDGLADEIQTRKTNSSVFYIWKTPLTCAFAFAPEPLKFLNGLFPSNSTKILDFLHLIIYILFCNPLSDQIREELIKQLITLRSPEEQISWLNLLEEEGHVLLARKLGNQLLDRVSTISQANDLNRPLAVDPLLNNNIIHEIIESQQLTSYQRLSGNEELAYKSLEKVFELSGILRAQIKNQLAQIDKNIQGSDYLRFFEEANELVPHSSVSRLQLVNEMLSANRLAGCFKIPP